jgi:hypothetical protein
MGRIKKIVFIALATMGLVLWWHNSVFVFSGPDNGFLLTKTEEVRYSIYLPAFYIHIITGSLVLILGAFQLNQGIHTRYRQWHRTAGKVYLFTVLIFTAPSGLVMSFYANGGVVAKIGFALLAILWWIFTWYGFRYATNRNWNSHRKFMLRSYALTFSAVTLRLYSFLFALAELRGEGVYLVIAWLSWVPSLLVMEMYIRAKDSKVVVSEIEQ